MSNTKHAPGPWFLSPQKRFIRADGIHGWNVASIEDQPPFTEANAKLIVAAPDLLEVLTTIYSVFKNAGFTTSGPYKEYFEKANAVIKKATE